MLYIGKEVTVTDAMVTGRMPERKKQQGLRVLKRDGMNASQAVNLLFDRLIEEGSADFLLQDGERLRTSGGHRRRALSIASRRKQLNTVRRYDEGRDQT